MNGTTLGNRESQHDIEDLLNFNHVKRKLVWPATRIGQFQDKQQQGNGLVNNEHDILDVQNCKPVIRKPIIPAITIDHFLKIQGIHLDDETKRDNYTTGNVEFMHTPIINEHNKGLDNLVDKEGLGGDEYDAEEEINIDCNPKGMC